MSTIVEVEGKFILCQFVKAKKKGSQVIDFFDIFPAL